MCRLNCMCSFQVAVEVVQLTKMLMVGKLGDGSTPEQVRL